MSRFTAVSGLAIAILLLAATASAQPGRGGGRESGNQSRQNQAGQQSGSSQPPTGFRSVEQAQSGNVLQGGRNGAIGRGQQQGRRGRQQRGQPGQQNYGRSQGNDLTRTFTENAMKFDLNRDRQLAAHELRSLFIVLTSQMQQQTQFTNTTPLRNRVFNGNQNFSGTTSGNSGGGGGAPQGLAIRQAIFIFLQLVMQFDSNNDGLLSQAELNQFANALLQNNLNLAAAAGGRGNSTARRSGGTNQQPSRSNQQQFSRNNQFGGQQQQQQQSISVIGIGGERGSSGRGGDGRRSRRGDRGSRSENGNTGPGNSPPRGNRGGDSNTGRRTSTGNSN